jgi:hypothetical protein
MIVFAIDPGSERSAYCVIDADTLRPLENGNVENNMLLEYIGLWRFDTGDHAVVEGIESFGMPVGAEVHNTSFWAGRFFEALIRRGINPPQRIYRHEEKLHICGTTRAKDANIRRALIDRFAQHDKATGKGTKANPDWFYGFKADEWQCYAVGLTYIETKLGRLEVG